MEKPYTLRPFRREDLDGVMMINRVCLPENYSSYFFQELHEKLPAGFLVAEEGDKLVGYIMCRLEYGGSSFKRFGLAKKGHVVSLAVLPEYRRQGLGTALIKEVMLNLHKQGANECFLEVRVSNKPALALYQSLGFVEVNRLSSYYLDGEDAYVLAVKLDDKVYAV